MAALKKYWWILLLGLVLRLVISATTYHPDVKTPAVSSATVFNFTSLNFYQNSAKLSSTEILDDLPISYLILLPGHAIGRVLVDQNTESIFIGSSEKLFGSFSLMTYLFYLKLPFIIFDLLVGILLAYLVNINQRGKILSLWIFNPITLWASFGIGQFDIIPAFFIMLSVLFLKHNRLGWAAFALGLGGSIKIAPFFLLPLLLWQAKNVTDRIRFTVISTVPYLISTIPYLPISEFRQNALFAPQANKSLFAQISLSGGEAILLVPTVLIFIYLLYFSKKRSFEDFIQYSVVILLSVLALTHFHMQWFLWVMPLLLIRFQSTKDNIHKLSIALLFISWLIMLFLFESSLQVRLFAPLIPSLDQAQGLAETLPKDLATLLRNLAASIFAAATLYIGIRLAKS